MKTFTARVINGRLVIEELCGLPEGTVLRLTSHDDGNDLDDDERAERDAAIEGAWARAQAGEEPRPIADLLRRLRPQA